MVVFNKLHLTRSELISSPHVFHLAPSELDTVTDQLESGEWSLRMDEFNSAPQFQSDWRRALAEPKSPALHRLWNTVQPFVDRNTGCILTLSAINHVYVWSGGVQWYPVVQATQE